MTRPVLVLVPHGRDSQLVASAGVQVVVYATAADVTAALAAHPALPAVIWSDALPASEVPAGVQDHPVPVIEVRSARWDGATPSPLSAACRGVVSGFGVGGVAAALSLLSEMRQG